MNKLLSVIIPTYNMEDYLEKCLDSLILPEESLMLALEVIVIIDGATDRSSLIARQYQNIYPVTFKVIDKENGNYGSCINRGLQEATGKYIRVLDADDSYDTESFSRYLKALLEVNADLVLSDYKLVDGAGHIIEERTFQLNPMQVVDIVKVLKPVAELEMHAITYKRQILLDISYRQTEGISYTDTEWAFIPLIAVSSVCYINYQVYTYLVGRPGQTMDKNVFKKNILQMIKVYEHLMKFYSVNQLELHKNKYLFDHRIDGFIQRTYGQALYQNILASNDLKSLDDFVKKYKQPLYASLANLNDGYVWYVKQWRKHHYALPWYSRVVVRLVQLKRKYL